MFLAVQSYLQKLLPCIMEQLPDQLYIDIIYDIVIKVITIA